MKGDWGYIDVYPCPVDPGLDNLTPPMINTLLDRYEGQILEQQTFYENLIALNDSINNIIFGKKNTRAKLLNCSSFVELLKRNLYDQDLEFKRQVEYSRYL